MCGVSRVVLGVFFKFWGKIGDRLRMLFKINSSSDFNPLCMCIILLHMLQFYSRCVLEYFYLYF